MQGHDNKMCRKDLGGFIFLKGAGIVIVGFVYSVVCLSESGLTGGPFGPGKPVGPWGPGRPWNKHMTPGQ